jgi:hypothetical protein
MPIPFYNLHDLDAQQLADELIRQIPAHTPEWRNPAPGDPGRALIDLFAWMGDKLLYRVNLLPERQRLMFLQLLDMPLRPETPATGLLQLSHAAPKDRSVVELPPRSLVTGAVEFETIDTGHILPIDAMVYVKRLPNTEEANSVAGIQTNLQSVYDLESSAPYVTTPLFTDGRSINGGFDVARETLDQTLWIALLAPEAIEDKAAFRQTVFTRNGSAPILVNVGFAPQADAPLDTNSIDASKPRPENWIWQMPTGQSLETGLPEYTTLGPAITNTTDGFSRAGVMRLALPDSNFIGLPENDPDVDVLAGVGDRPPRIDDPEVSNRLVGWMRMRPKLRAETLVISWIGLNTVEIEQHRSLRNIILGTASSGSGQKIALPVQSVDTDSLILDVQRSDGMYETWSQTDDLSNHDRTDAVFTLDSEAGIIGFGDGVRGALPPRGAKIRASVLRHGGGRAGNLGIQTLETISHSRLKANQPIPTTGGEEAETLPQAEQRLPAHLRHGDRAVTERDFKDLAPLTPGIDLARVEVLPRFRPYQRLSDVAGAVSVLVVPRPSNLMAACPKPDRAMLSAVTDYLDQRRLMGTELHVIGPEYKLISVSAAVKVKEGFEPDKVLDEVESSLRLFLAPVEPGGRDGLGWQLGRTISNLELEVAVARVAGLDAVYGVNLFVRSVDKTEWNILPTEGSGLQSVTLEKWMLPELAEVILTQDENGPVADVHHSAFGGGGGSGDGGSGDGSLSTPIPVVPEIC